MKIRATTLGALTLLLLASPASAQDNPLGQPLLDADGNIRDDAFIHIPLRTEDGRYGEPLDPASLACRRHPT